MTYPAQCNVLLDYIFTDWPGCKLIINFN